jgi:hypothetical protein
MIGGAPTKCTVDGIGRGYSKLGAVSCMKASASATTEWNIGIGAGLAPSSFRTLFRRRVTG